MADRAICLLAVLPHGGKFGADLARLVADPCAQQHGHQGDDCYPGQIGLPPGHDDQRGEHRPQCATCLMEAAKNRAGRTHAHG